MHAIGIQHGIIQAVAQGRVILNSPKYTVNCLKLYSLPSYEVATQYSLSLYDFCDCSVNQNPSEQLALEDTLDLSESCEVVGFD